MSIRDDLKAYLDGELPFDRAEAVRLAIEANPEIAREAEALRSLTQGLNAYSAQLQPQGKEELLARLRVETRPARPAGSRLRLAYAGGAVGLLMVFVVFIQSQGWRNPSESMAELESATAMEAPAKASSPLGPQQEEAKSTMVAPEELAEAEPPSPAQPKARQQGDQKDIAERAPAETGNAKASEKSTVSDTKASIGVSEGVPGGGGAPGQASRGGPFGAEMQGFGGGVGAMEQSRVQLVRLEVEDVSAAFVQIRKIAQDQGGLVRVNTQENSAWILVEAERVVEVIERLGRLGPEYEGVPINVVVRPEDQEFLDSHPELVPIGVILQVDRG